MGSKLAVSARVGPQGHQKHGFVAEVGITHRPHNKWQVRLMLPMMGWKWRHGDVSRHTGGDLAAALGRIKAKTYVVPFSRDMFFPPDDCEAEQKLIPSSKFRVVDSLWAHFAMFCMTKSDRDQIDYCIRDLLAEPVG